MKADKTLGLSLTQVGTVHIKRSKPIGDLEKEQDFNTFEDFLAKFPLDEYTLPVCIVPPEDADDYWLIQLALPMKNLTINCCVWSANTHQVTKYRLKCIRQYREAIGVNPNVTKKDTDGTND